MSGAPGLGEGASAIAPNIVMIVSDQHRADWLGCAGNRAVRTPHLDGLARDGVRFTAAYCTAPLCTPSRMSLLTGRQPHHTGVFSNAASLSSDLPTCAHALGLAGYETVLCGRMHFVGADQRHGFERRLVGDLTPCYPGGPRADYARWEGGQRQGLQGLALLGPGDSVVQRYDEAVVGACEEYVADRVGDGPDRPLFLTVGLFGPHSPFVCPPDLYARAERALDAGDPPLPPDREPRHPWVADWFRRLGADRATPEQIRRARANYVGLIDRLDLLVGRVVAAARSLPGPTIVVYLSDHGEMAGDRGMFWKQSFFEGAVKVPLIWCALGPDTPAPAIARGHEVDLPVSLADLAPTLAALGGAPPLPNTDGLARSPLLKEAMPEERVDWRDRAVFSETVIAGAPLRMVRRDRHKLIYYHGYQDVQLFDLEAYPGEQRDLGREPATLALREELLACLLEGWDPAQIAREMRAQGEDERYLGRWGRAVGMGPLDIWPGGGIVV